MQQTQTLECQLEAENILNQSFKFLFFSSSNQVALFHLDSPFIGGVQMLSITNSHHKKTRNQGRVVRKPVNVNPGLNLD